MNWYGLSLEKGYSLKPGYISDTLELHALGSNYLHRQAIYQGYRLLFGDGYVVPSMMVHLKNTKTDECWTVEVFPNVQSISSLRDFKHPSQQYGLGIQLVGSYLFPLPSLAPEIFKSASSPFFIERSLTPQDHLERAYFVRGTLGVILKSSTQSWIAPGPGL